MERAVGEAAAFHARPLPEPAARTLSVLEVSRPALVLGSTQPETVAERPALVERGIDLVRRRSGGGAVLLVPGEALWVDVVVPRGDVVWDDDVGRAGHWLGAAWAAALGDLGVATAVHRGGLVGGPWSSLVCFAGLGPGEVTRAGRKLVGMGQRRGRASARFQCLLLRRWAPGDVLDLLALDPRARAAAAGELADVATGLDVAFSEVVGALRAQLPGG